MHARAEPAPACDPLRGFIGFRRPSSATVEPITDTPDTCWSIPDMQDRDIFVALDGTSDRDVDPIARRAMRGHPSSRADACESCQFARCQRRPIPD